MKGPAWLFCPGDRPERFAKAAAAADHVIVDLEDGVGEGSKEVARRNLSSPDLPVDRTVVRIHGGNRDLMCLDIDAVRATPFQMILIAKCEDVAEIARLLPGRRLIPQLESAAAIRNAGAIAAHPAVEALSWGSEDVAVSLGAVSARDEAGVLRPPLQLARSSVLLAAAASGKWAMDAVVLDIADELRIAADARSAFADGFSVIPCIHPRQIPIVREAFLPGDVERSAAQRVLQGSATLAVSQIDGRMVDAPVREQARRIATAGEGG